MLFLLDVGNIQVRTALKALAWFSGCLFYAVVPIWYFFFSLLQGGITGPIILNIITVLLNLLLLGVIPYSIIFRKSMIWMDYLILGCPYPLWIFSYWFFVYVKLIEIKTMTNLYIVEPMIINLLIVIYFGIRAYMTIKKFQEIKIRKVVTILMGAILFLAAIVPLAVPWMGE